MKINYKKRALNSFFTVPKFQTELCCLLKLASYRHCVVLFCHCIQTTPAAKKKMLNTIFCQSCSTTDNCDAFYSLKKNLLTISIKQKLFGCYCKLTCVVTKFVQVNEKITAWLTVFEE